jgi:Spy/CpxP family protein refolding chaperone
MNTRLLLAASLVLAMPIAYAQDTTQTAPTPSPQAAPAPPPPPNHRNAMDHNWGPRRVHDREMERSDRDERGPGRGDGADRVNHLLPFGMWWKNPEVAARIGLSAEQQKRMDDLFLQSRVQLIHLHASLQEEQLLLEPLMDANTFDQAKARAQIDKIADTRAELEKTNAGMLLSIRGVLTADQWAKLRNRDRSRYRPEGAPENSGQPGAPGSN